MEPSFLILVTIGFFQKGHLPYQQQHRLIETEIPQQINEPVQTAQHKTDARMLEKNTQHKADAVATM